MSLKDTIRKILREEVELPISVRRRIKISEEDILNYLRKFSIRTFEPNKKIEAIVGKACSNTAYEILDATHTHIDDKTFDSLLEELSKYLKNKYGEQLKEFMQNFFNESGDSTENVYVFWKHADRNGGNGFKESFHTWNELLMQYGTWFPSLDWADIKDTLDSMVDRKPLLIVTPDDKFNTMGYYFSLVKINRDTK